jgi:hypothetical protein
MSDEKKVLSKADLLSGALLKRELVYIEDWKASVWLRELSGDVIREYKRRINKLKDAGIADVPDEQGAEMMCYLLASSICDEAGALQFTEEEARALTVNSLNTLTDLVNKVFAVSGAKVTASGDVVSEVTDDLPNDLMTSSPESSPLNSDEPAQKS